MDWKEVANKQAGFKLFKKEPFDFESFVRKNFCPLRSFMRWKRVLGTESQIIVCFDKEMKFSKKVLDVVTVTNESTFTYRLTLKQEC